MNKLLLTLSCIGTLTHAADVPENLYNIHQKRFLKELYYTIKPIVGDIKDTIIQIPSSILQEFLPEHPHDDQVATVRFTDFDEICKDEKRFTKQRLIRVKQGFSKLLNTEVAHHKIPRIAVCCSGGGHRAMVLTFGFLKGLQDVGLLDCTTYMAGLSGSTWAMAPWIASQQSLNNYITTLPNKLHQGLESVKHPILLKRLAGILMTKALYGQFISMIDVSGPTLANTLLTDFGMDRLDVTLSESHAHIADGKVPLPIYTAVTADVEPYEWLEFTPFEVGSTYMKAYIPTWAYGRKFKHGRSVNFAAEQSLGYLMGIFGSAFGIDIEDAVRHTSEKIESFISKFPRVIQSVMHDIIGELVNSPLDDVRLAPSTLPNFTYKTETRPLKHDKMLTLIDAGIHFNLPLPPLLRETRQVDIIFVYDASGSVLGCKNLRWAQEYIQAKGHKFPPIDFDIADKQVMSIFRNEDDPTCPIVVYFPRIKNEAYSTTFDPEDCLQNSYCSTLNFTYNKDEINELMGLAEFAVKQHAHELVGLMHEMIEQQA